MKAFLEKIIKWCSTHIWQTVVIGVAVVGIITTSIVLPIALSNKDKEPTKYNVTYVLDGKGPDFSVDVESGSKLTKPVDPSSADYTFTGWYKESEFVNQWNFDTDVVTTDMNLFAKWHLTLKSFGLNITQSSLDVEDTLQLTAVPNPSGAALPSDLVWSSDNAEVASVDQSGLVTAVSGGKTNIKVTSNSLDLTVSCEVTVTDNRTFKAVYDSTDGKNTLTFYFNQVSYVAGETLGVYDNLPINAEDEASWGYDTIRIAVKKVVIDSSVAKYNGLTSLNGMFEGMKNADSIEGAEYLNTSNVTKMDFAFYSFGYNLTDFNCVPNVSNWDVSNLVKASSMFANFGRKSKNIDKVPDVSKWNTQNLEDASKMFNAFASDSTEIVTCPDVSKWKTEKIKSTDSMFYFCEQASQKLASCPDVSKWVTSSLVDASSMFYMFGCSSTVIVDTPDISNWNTSNLTEIDGLFYYYGRESGVLKFELDLSKWDTSKLTKVNNVFYYVCSNGFKSGNATWVVKIPAKTGDKDNTTSAWYVGDGSKSIEPTSKQSFTLVAE